MLTLTVSIIVIALIFDYTNGFHDAANSAATSDARKTMGIIALVPYTGGYLTDFRVPVWVILSAHAAIALGTLTGGWRIVRTMGARPTRLRPRSGFRAETAAAASIVWAWVLTIPASA
ncbi:MAG TPA: inorganic phosphate transporter, partial [Bryobacteraceae bacterium]|nr:inorganic phosphate transporter [Bryobacteraceae bacterium]